MFAVELAPQGKGSAKTDPASTLFKPQYNPFVFSSTPLSHETIMYKSARDNAANYETFRECVSKAILQRSDGREPKVHLRRKGRATSSSKRHSTWTESHDPEEMAEFIDYIAGETFNSLPEEVQALSYSAVHSNKPLEVKYSDSMSQSDLEALSSAVELSVSDSLCAYGMIPEPSDVEPFLHQIFRDYIEDVTAPPPLWSETRATSCEICGRDWIPLTYHHLIPKEVHAKAIKRKWHEEWMLNSVAWLCRACHTFVHRMASNEELAKEWYTAERLLERDDVQNWARWAARLRSELRDVKGM